MNAEQLLAVWEKGESQSWLQRALLLLAAAWPERSLEAWAQVSIGVRDTALLHLREALFGKRLEALATCPACGEQLELDFSTQDIVAPMPEKMALQVHADNFFVAYRLPTSEDLLQATGMDVTQARQQLLTRCFYRVEKEGIPFSVEMLPQDVVQQVLAAMVKDDPQAEVKIALDCPACAHHWLMDFDVLSYLWSELRDWAARMMREVHQLAGAYGWAERDILGLSATRRAQYLALIHS